MTVTTSVMMLAAIALGVIVLTDSATVTWVYLLAGVLGLANTFDNPARRTLVNDLVPDEDVSNAVSLNSTLVDVGPHHRPGPRRRARRDGRHRVVLHRQRAVVHRPARRHLR